MSAESIINALRWRDLSSNALIPSEKALSYVNTKIVNNIPRFVSSDNYAALFGAQWLRYQKTQLDSNTKLPITKNRLIKALGEPLWNQLAGKKILEAGCGAGRFTEVLLERADFLVSADLSLAVEANHKNCPISPKHLIMQADITNIPLEKEQFDVVICLGVVQHTPDPKKTLQALYDQVKPGGYLIFDHYKFYWGYYTKFLSLCLRPILKRLPQQQAVKTTEKLVDIFLPYNKLVSKRSWSSRLLLRLSPITTYYHIYPDLDEKLQKEWAALDTHDALTDWYKHLTTKPKMDALLKSMGCTDIHSFYGVNGVVARVTKPQRFEV